MKKSIIFLIPTIALCGCVNNSAAGKSKGIIDCSEISAYQNGTLVFKGAPKSSYDYVFEYENEQGKKIYADARLAGDMYNLEQGNYTPIQVFKDSFDSEPSLYSYSRFVGYLLYEEHYYFNLGSRTIDSEYKWSKYKSEANPDSGMTDKYNNNEAIRCARKGYYNIKNYYALNPKIVLSEANSSLERHVYTMLGEDCTVTYIPTVS